MPQKHCKRPKPYPDLLLSLPACHKGILELDLQQVLGLQQRLLEAGHLRLQLTHITTGLQKENRWSQQEPRCRECSLHLLRLKSDMAHQSRTAQ